MPPWVTLICSHATHTELLNQRLSHVRWKPRTQKNMLKYEYELNMNPSRPWWIQSLSTGSESSRGVTVTRTREVQQYRESSDPKFPRRRPDRNRSEVEGNRGRRGHPPVSAETSAASAGGLAGLGSGTNPRYNKPRVTDRRCHVAIECRVSIQCMTSRVKAFHWLQKQNHKDLKVH